MENELERMFQELTKAGEPDFSNERTIMLTLEEARIIKGALGSVRDGPAVRIMEEKLR